MTDNAKPLTVAEAKLLLQKSIKDKNKDWLWEWIREFLKLEIPREKICPDHCAPFDFVSDYLFGNIKDAVALANRSGGKTMIFGMLDAIMAFLADETEIATVGAIQFQAQKAYDYFKGFSERQPFISNIDRFTMKQTDCVNNSSVQVLVGTMSGVNSPHPQLLFLDEIDLMQWQVLQQALSMPQSKHGVEAKTVLTSTRKFGAGPMQRILDEANTREIKTYQWCIWEVIEKLPEEKDKHQRVLDVFGSALPRNVQKANGYYTWSDAIQKYKSLDSETWETEWLCLRPGKEGLIYGTSYSDDNNLLYGWSPDPSALGGVYLFEDFGYGDDHPDAVLFVWIPPQADRLVIFDELYMTKYGTDDIWNSIVGKLQEYNLTVSDLKGWACDYHGLTEIHDRTIRGAPILPKNEDSDLYTVDNGIKLVKKFLQSGRLMLTDKCVNFRWELQAYKWKKNADGTYSKLPEKKNDHGSDATHYGLAALYAMLFTNAFGDKKSDPEKHSQVEERRKTQDKPVFSGMTNSNDWR